MSHDQRPGRMRVVKDPSGSDRRRGNAVTADGDAGSFEVVGGAGRLDGDASGAEAADTASLPLLPAALFLLACVAGGVLVAAVRPMGLG